MNKIMASVFKVCFFTVFFSSLASADCFVWEKESLDQYVGKCTNQNYERLPIEGGPEALHCTNWTYPLYWNCHNIFHSDGNPGKDLSLAQAANQACGCE